MPKMLCFGAVLISCFLFNPTISRAADAPSRFKVLVIMSYHEEMPWEREIRDGIEQELAGKADTRYFYLNIKNNPAGGAEKAEQAYRYFMQFQPDGVIAADDDAQRLFVVPYLRDASPLPVVFCGVNADPASYGYPATNVTGIIERAHFRESIVFLQQLLPQAKSIGFIVTDNYTGRGYREQIYEELAGYPVKSASVSLVSTLDGALRAASRMKSNYDAIFLIALEGLTTEGGRSLAEKESFRLIASHFGKPVVGINRFNVRYDMLCAVAKTGQEQGGTAARMLMNTLGGTPICRIPVSRNVSGKRVLNITIMNKFGIRPRPVLLVGTELVRSE